MQVSGTAATGETVTAAALTDTALANRGNYIITGLPAGNYTVCEVVQAGWKETWPMSGPACTTGVGWTITIRLGSAGFVNFGNLTAP